MAMALPLEERGGKPDIDACLTGPQESLPDNTAFNMPDFSQKERSKRIGAGGASSSSPTATSAGPAASSFRFGKQYPVVSALLDRFWEAGYEAYLVGGCVRDALRGEEPKDYDIASSATPDEVKTLFAGLRVIGTGLRHGTVTLLYGGFPFEITTFRIESDYSDSRHPDAVSFTRSLADDLSRRDFTINAMAYDRRTGLVDPYGGREDLASGILRCVGDPERRFSEDALRILRALRFSAQIGLRLEEKTEKAAVTLSSSLLRVSAERAAVELKKLFCGPDASRVLLSYVEILGVVLPELLPMRGLDQKNKHHIHELLTHTALTVEHVPPEPNLRLAALFHDCGKPKVFSQDEEGVGHFYGHAKVGAALADAALARLKFDNASREEIVRLVKWHDLPLMEDERSVRRLLGRMTPAFFEKLLLLKRADNLAQSPAYHDRQAFYDRIEAMAKDIIARQDCLSLRTLALGGDDLLALGMKPGRDVGALLRRLLDSVLNGEVANEKDALLRLAKASIDGQTNAAPAEEKTERPAEPEERPASVSEQ